MNKKKEILLEQVIVQYLQYKEPIGSESLKAFYGSSFSSATIRNHFKVLASEGWLFQPHISSGRIPTNAALKNHWIKNINTKNPLILDLKRLKENSYKYGICCILSIEVSNKLQRIINIEDRYLVLLFEQSQAVMNYNASLERFLQELASLDLVDIKKIAYEVRALELLNSLENAQRSNVSYFCLNALNEMLDQSQNEEVFLDIINGFVFHKLHNGIYFDEILPKDYLGIMQEVRIQELNGRAFCVGKIDRDYTKFYAELAS
ncbi:MAG: HrcA family transcriptional regulator [Helicobacter sp.]|uniref:HrcA family transcriptional regulator n=1 Tax=Helicobacter sp. 10-6591 TaxID=2004998 RepID=UPI000DCC837B|nr:HrcA family transcriptional regulator [Helicobacter sp. 10-6591]MCI6217990.1 HrcA family transcriptional regulator [Helicobacter sp.]MCI7485732.1 HrcA family transcriptional regulator [Helicobacter sp.]MDD7567330.1 HrcA family transcriptional regulator [Helicobacter sp.]MDY5740557.1 HrcA family transcriptional regulator [Helicobacter sp.]RAX55074.1 hypothetical protein CCY97_04690 [Helicobacter sp. 10-6591]